jgi:ketosteroid isomerase-like protein
LGDIDGVLRHVDPRVELHPSAWSGGGVASGHQGIRNWLRQFGDGIDQLRLEVEEVVADGERVLVLGTAHDSRDRGRHTQRLGWIFELDDGLIFRTRSYDTWDEARRSL